MRRIAVVGHVEHVTLGRAEAPFGAGDIVHLSGPRFLAAGGGGIAFAQLCKSDAEVHFFTAVGDDAGGRAVLERISGAGRHVHVHAATRAGEHPRVVVIVGADGRRTIIVTGGPLQPAASDPLPWSLLKDCDAAYFTGADPESLRLARAARLLGMTARRIDVARAARVAPDVIVGSVSDPRENAALAAYDPAPRALVLTDGPRPVRVVRAEGESFVPAPPAPARIEGDYGAGDSFAAALTYYLARGLSIEEACRRAGPHGAAVLAGIEPFENQLELRAPAAPGG
jgi:ribokinase